MQVNDQKFADATEVVDGNTYANCSFERCRIIYRGGDLPSITNSSFSDCAWLFEEAAERTLFFMKMLYHGMGDNGPALVETAIKQIREPLAS